MTTLRSTDFGTPEAILEDPDLTKAQKRAFLSSWEYDCRALEVAEEEGMLGGEGSLIATSPGSVGAIGP